MSKKNQTKGAAPLPPARKIPRKELKRREAISDMFIEMSNDETLINAAKGVMTKDKSDLLLGGEITVSVNRFLEDTYAITLSTNAKKNGTDNRILQFKPIMLVLYCTTTSRELHRCHTIPGMIAWFKAQHNITIVEKRLRQAIATGNAYYFMGNLYCIAHEG